MAKNNKINIVILMAGRGQRFKDEGFKTDKPFIKINNKMLIEYVLDSFDRKHNFYLVIRKEFEKLYFEELNFLKKKYKVNFSYVSQITTGAASTALLAIEKIQNLDLPLLVADSDNFYLNNEANNFINFSLENNLDGSLATFSSNSSDFSYIQIKDSKIIGTKEKEVVSNFAISGLYFFKNIKHFLYSSIEMIAYNSKIKDEFYMSNTFNFLLKRTQNIGFFNMDNKNYISIGTPALLRKYSQMKNEK